MYAGQTTQNKSFLKRFSHGSRYKIAVELLNPGPEDSILDYGTGDGFMLTRIRLENNNCRVVGYEPDPHMYKELGSRLKDDSEQQSIEIVNDISSVSSRFNKICCLEVLEHLTEENQRKEIEKMLRLLSDDGRLIISVPIEVGISSLLKNLARLLLGQPHQNTNFKSLLYSLLGLKISRGNEFYIYSHIGFYYHDLEKLLLSLRLKITKKVFSPIQVLRGFINSQVFFIVEKS